MGFRRRLIYFLVHSGGLSNREAAQYVRAGKVKINGKVAEENRVIADEDSIELNGRCLRARFRHVYLRFYKPRGFESSLHPELEHSLFRFFAEQPKSLSIAGRLDKDSEGLLLLSTNGKWVQSIIDPRQGKEKEYVVELDREPGEHLVESFRQGMRLGDCVTQPAVCVKLDERRIRVVLKEGRNRQIRRMCHKLGYQVIRLLRVRIEHIGLGDLKPGEAEVFKI